jgi:hypothetical protein
VLDAAPPDVVTAAVARAHLAFAAMPRVLADRDSRAGAP